LAPAGRHGRRQRRGGRERAAVRARARHHTPPRLVHSAEAARAARRRVGGAGGAHGRTGDGAPHHRRRDLRRRESAMNATERAAVLQSAALFDELYPSADERTLRILHRRRQGSVVRRRGWLVRRALLVADVLGLAFAFLVAETIFPPTPTGVGLQAEYAFFLL